MFMFGNFIKAIADLLNFVLSAYPYNAICFLKHSSFIFFRL